jgi:hypothetical protein
MFIRNVKQSKMSKGRNIFLVSFEMLLFSHKAIIETRQIHLSIVLLHYLCFEPCIFLFGHFCATCINYLQ